MKETFTAKTIEEARAAAAQAFGVDESAITFEIIEEPKKGLFGMKGEAKLEAEYEPPRWDSAKKYLNKIIAAMGFSVTDTVSEIDGGAMIVFEGEDSAYLIGKHGETLDALQYIASMSANRGEKDFFRISVDAKGYREKRIAALKELAGKISSNVLKTGYSAALEPMNPYERRIIHATVSEIEGVNSRSVGEDPYRKVIISSNNAKQRPERPERDFQKRDGRRGGKFGGNQRKNDRFGKGERRNYDRNSKDYEGPRSLDLKTSFEKDYKKPRPEDNINAGLYGKIEL